MYVLTLAMAGGVPSRVLPPQASAPDESLMSLVYFFEADPEALSRLRRWSQTLMETVDITALLADFGFAPRTAMASEVAERLRYKLLPSTPETDDASELFMLVFPDRFDARWLHALDSQLIARITTLLTPQQLEEGVWVC